MKKGLEKFGQYLKGLRLVKGLSIREMCRKTGYDPSNWSKIERGLLPPSADKKTLLKWAKALGVKDLSGFVDRARIAQGVIPEDVLSGKSVLESLPAFFRTLRNEKPNQKEINNLLKLLKGQTNK